MGTGASTHIAGTHTANMPSTDASTHIAADHVAANMPATGASTHIAGTHTANMPSTDASTHIAADHVVTANMLPTQHEDDVIAVNIPANRFGQLQVDDIPLELPKSTFSTVSFLQKVEHKK